MNEWELKVISINDRMSRYKAVLYRDGEFMMDNWTDTRWGARWWAFLAKMVIKWYDKHPLDMATRTFRI